METEGWMRILIIPVFIIPGSDKPGTIKCCTLHIAHDVGGIILPTQVITVEMCLPLCSD